MRVDDHQAIHVGGPQHVGHDPRPDRLAGRRPSILSGVGEVGDDRGDPSRAGAVRRIREQEQLGEVLLRRWAGGLHHVGVGVAELTFEADVDLPVGEPFELPWHELDVEVGGRGVGGPFSGTSGDQSHVLSSPDGRSSSNASRRTFSVSSSSSAPMAGIGGSSM